MKGAPAPHITIDPAGVRVRVTIKGEVLADTRDALALKEGAYPVVYYIPRKESAGGPRWFVVRVSNAFLSSPNKVSSVEYLLFTQATPGGPWRNAVEPYLLSGASAPQVAVGGDGLATAVATTATSLATAPGQIPTVTAASLGGTDCGTWSIPMPATTSSAIRWGPRTRRSSPRSRGWSPSPSCEGGRGWRSTPPAWACCGSSFTSAAATGFS